MQNEFKRLESQMQLNVREMELEEVRVVIDYFHRASPEYLEMLGVDPSRLLEPKQWRERYSSEYGRPIEERRSFLVIWESEGTPIGWSACDKITYGQQAYMHLHVLDPQNRARGYGVVCVRKSLELYFEALKLQRLFSEPNALNVAPNRTLQKAGFKYIKSHKTVPGPYNYHHTVTRWMMEKVDMDSTAPPIPDTG